MPNVWTHIIFGNKMSEHINYPIPPPLKPFLAYGAQGPDPFFYHKFWPWIKEKPVTELGAKIHYEQCGPYLLEMIEYAQKNQDEKLRAYVFGFISHHILDRNTHPYIIYRSGEQENRHQKLEIIIDCLLLKEWYDREAWKTPVYKEIDIGKQLYAPLKELLTHVNDQFFPDMVERVPVDYIEQSYTDMLKAWKILYDPFGWKNKLLKKWISPFSHHKNFDAKDYLNREKNEWVHPTNLNEKYEHSFEELWAQAEEEGEQILALVVHYWTEPKQEIYSQLQERIGNRSYDTGKDCTLGLINQHYDPIL